MAFTWMTSRCSIVSLRKGLRLSLLSHLHHLSYVMVKKFNSLIFQRNNLQIGIGISEMEIHRAQNPTHTFDAPGTYVITLEVTNAFGSNSTVQTVIVNEIPEVSVTTNDDDNVVCLYDANVQSQVSNGNIFSGSGISGTSFNPSIAGIGVHVIEASYTDFNGCTGNTTISITVEACADLDNLSANEVRVYPNPNGGQFFIEGMDKGIAYTIFDFHGRAIYDGSFNHKKK